jgi:uncharacterized membrane protein YeaQ/YmgE (transglycosylase-associated protein family)
MLRGCIIGAAIGFFPWAALDIVVAGAKDGFLFPVLGGIAGAASGAIVGNVLNRFHRTFQGPPGEVATEPGSRA